MDPSLSYSFTATEVLPLGTSICIKASVPVDIRSARSGISIRHGWEQYAVEIAFPDDGNTINISTKTLTVGGYDLVISELLAVDGERFPKLISIPFKLDQLTGQVPDGIRVENVARLQIGELRSKKLRPGQDAERGTEYVEFIKCIQLDGNKPMELAFNQLGERIDGVARISEFMKRRQAEYGRLHESLFNHIQGKDDQDAVDVVVWPLLDKSFVALDRSTIKQTKGPTEAEKEAEKEIATSKAQVTKALQNLGAKIKDRLTQSPPVYATLSVAQVRQLKDTGPDHVGLALLDDAKGFPDLADSQAIGRADLAHSRGFAGLGVKVAVWEKGPDVLTNLSFVGRYQPNPLLSDHARLTSAIIQNTEIGKPHGYAPNCSLYSANSYDIEALEWALNQGCTVISQSFHRDTENNTPDIQADDILKDWMVTHYPFPTIIQAAGNIDEGATFEYVNHKGYNSMNVGSHDDAAAFMAISSSSKNPGLVPGAHGDRELPEICANGTGVTANGMSMSGTSFAAPAVAGAAALIRSVDRLLCSWPEGCRAILLASAGRNVSGSTWSIDIVLGRDSADGAGALDCDSAFSTAQSHQLIGNVPTARGWNVGILSRADFDPDTSMSNWWYNVRTPFFSVHGASCTCVE